MRKGALRSALTDALQSGKLTVIQDLSFDAPKTKRAVELLQALDLDGKVLVILREPTETGAIELSFRNLPDVKIAYAGGLGVYDLLRADRVVFTAGALDAIQGLPAAEASSADAAGPVATRTVDDEDGKDGDVA
jgi:large subunit ribosomal protein L4